MRRELARRGPDSLVRVEGTRAEIIEAVRGYRAAGTYLSVSDPVYEPHDPLRLLVDVRLRDRTEPPRVVPPAPKPREPATPRAVVPQWVWAVGVLTVLALIGLLGWALVTAAGVVWAWATAHAVQLGGLAVLVVVLGAFLTPRFVEVLVRVRVR